MKDIFKNTKILVPVLCVLIGLGIGFFGGIQFKNYQLKKSAGNFQSRNGNAQQGGVRGGAVSGSILSMDDGGITVKLSDGSSKIVLFGDSTTYSNTIDASRADLKVGDNIAVFGSANSDGSVTATSVQINPKFQTNFAPISNPTNSGITNGTQTTRQSGDMLPPGGGPMMP